MLNEQTATQAHCVNREEVRRKLTLIMEHIESNDVRDDASKNWGHVGTMGKVSEDLDEVVRFLNI